MHDADLSEIRSGRLLTKEQSSTAIERDVAELQLGVRSARMMMVT